MLNNRRLLKCAEMISGKGTVCDVGTDHAFLPVYLVENGLCPDAVAGDIADGPLEAASATVNRAGLSDRISVVKSDGLKNISPDGITDVIIAGMGAETISMIIEAAPWLHNGINLVLQPMTKIPFMRTWLYANGYEIIREEAVTDEDYIYTVMNVRFSGYRININDVFAELGLFDFSDAEAVKYARKQTERLTRISDGQKRSGKGADTSAVDEKIRLITEISEGRHKVTVGEIYDEINRIAPFCTQDSWDNSGLLVGDRENEVTGIITALDITHEVIGEAAAKKANLIISHHPVIFSPLKNLSMSCPAVRLAANGISAICVHTPLDKAVNGINDMIADMLERWFEVSDFREPLIPEREGSADGDGRIVEITEEGLSAPAMAERLGKMFGGSPVKFAPGMKKIRRVAICSGSGGSLLSVVKKAGCDAYITGDIKHDVWLDAAAAGISLFDCGHFHTEKISAEYLAKLIRTSAYGIKTEAAETCRDVVNYIQSDPGN
ncbi:MAG: Nif3-like dinuclear metal center hexameric protein [Oscillospiraceae bacterium]|nr:Nif3-like dinuclear metal center hexameric protein [Oscillospiraceae bacterium]